MADIQNTHTYNLGVVVQETGINPDTLRAWERRYGLPMPERTDGGHRLYSERDIETVKWLLARLEEGLRIGRAASLWQELQDAGEDPLVAYPGAEEELAPFESLGQGKGTGGEEIFSLVRDAWLEAALAFEEEKAQRILSEAFARFALQDVWEEILVKGLARVGESWYEGEITVQQEHFATSLVIQRLHNLLDAAPPPIRKDVIIVACPPGEHHTVAPLLITLFLRRKGYPVIYLGANVPLMDLDKSIQVTQSSLVILTAQVLETAASLVTVAETLAKEGTLVGYGGRVFNTFPELEDRTPGVFLGSKLTDVAERVESLLKTNQKNWQDFQPPSPDAEVLLEAFETAAIRLWERMLLASRELGLTKRQIQYANQELEKAVRASLVLGNLSFLEAELTWLRGLLGSRGIQSDLLKSYLQAAAEALKDLLGDRENQISRAILNARKHLDEFSSD